MAVITARWTTPGATRRRRPHRRPQRAGGPIGGFGQYTRVVPFNDLAALHAALAPGDVACVLTEPALTNIGMVLPAEGFWRACASSPRQHGALLVIDETHTISTRATPATAARSAWSQTCWCWANRLPAGCRRRCTA